MNYFEFYGIPMKFNIDTAALRQQYFDFSKQFHPDFHANANDEIRDHVLEQSTRNNNAYKTLNNEKLRLRYILEITNTLVDGDKEILPQDFLMEMMELNEAIMEAEEQNKSALTAQVKKIEEQLEASIHQDCRVFDESGDLNILNQIKTNYLKQKYLLRIKESMLKFASL